MGGAASHPLEEQLLSEQEYSQAKHLSTVMLEADPENATLRLIAKAVRLAKVSCTQPARKNWGVLSAVTSHNVLWMFVLLIVGICKKKEKDGMQDFSQWLILSTSCTMLTNQVKTTAEWWTATDRKSLWQTFFGQRGAGKQLSEAGPATADVSTSTAEAQEAAPPVLPALQQPATAAGSLPVNNTNNTQTAPANNRSGSNSASSSSTRPSSRTSKPAKVHPSCSRVAPSATGPKLPPPSPPPPRSDATLKRSDGGSSGPTKGPWK